MQVKLFHQQSLSDLEMVVNQYLQGEDLYLHSFTVTPGQDGVVIGTLVYEEDVTPLDSPNAIDLDDGLEQLSLFDAGEPGPKHSSLGHRPFYHQQYSDDLDNFNVNLDASCDNFADLDASYDNFADNLDNHSWEGE